MKSFSVEELRALPDLPSADRRIDLTCPSCGAPHSVTIPGFRQLEVHDADIFSFYVRGELYEIVKSDGQYYKRLKRL